MPPTVIREMRSVGRAAPDRRGLAVLAADALPRVEVVGDRVDRAHHLDRPCRSGSRRGRASVTSPSSIRKPSATPNTKSPVAGFTWPPPSDVT